MEAEKEKLLELNEKLLMQIQELKKENEELKQPKDNIQVVHGGKNYGKTNSIVKEYISKDKIRKKLDELKSRNDNVCDKIKYEFKEKNKENNISLEMTNQILIAKMDILYELLEDESNG